MELARRQSVALLAELGRVRKNKTSAQHLCEAHHMPLGIPRWFIESHSDKLREVVFLRVVGSTSGVWSVRLYISPISIDSTLPDIKILCGWNEFAAFHGLAENDQVIFSLRVVSKFEVYVFHRTGELRDYPTLAPRKEYEAVNASYRPEAHEISQQRLGDEEMRQRKNEMRETDSFSSGMTLFKPSRISSPGFVKRLTFWKFDNPRGSRRVQTEAVLELPVMIFRVYGNRVRARVQLQGVGEDSSVRNVSCVSKAKKGRVGLYLKAGWGDFADDNMLRVRQELVFSLTADSFFTVRVCALCIPNC